MSTKVDLQSDELQVGGIEQLEEGTTFEETTKVVTQNGTEIPKGQPMSNFKLQLSSATPTDTETISKVSLKTILQSLSNRIKSLLNRFDATNGHSHTGTDSPKISYSNIDGKPDLSLKADLVDGLVPASQLPRFVDDIVQLLTFSDTAPTIGLENESRYYAPTAKLIYTYNLATTSWDSGLSPLRGVVYLVMDKKGVVGEYFQWLWAGSDMSPIPNTIDLGSTIHNSTTKDTLVDADEVGIVDSENGNTTKKTTWSNIKTKLTTLFDGLYIKLSNLVTTISSASTNAQIPSAKLLYDQLQLKSNLINNVFIAATLPRSANWNGITYGNGKYVAIDYTQNCNKVSYSIDGKTWTESTLPVSAYWTDLCYGNGKFVIIGSTGSFAGCYSEDAINWTSFTIPNLYIPNRVNYMNSLFVFTNGSSLNLVYSIDCIDFVEITASRLIAGHLAYGNEIYVAATGSGISYSYDLITWVDITGFSTSTSWFQICFGMGIFVCLNSNKFIYSEDGKTWTESTLPVSGTWCDITFGNNTFMAVANTSNRVVYSTNGINFSSTTLTENGTLHFITYGNGKFVTVSYGSNVCSYLDITTVNNLSNQRINYDAKDIFFDKTVSNLETDNTQGAIDVLAAKKESVYLQCACSDKTTPLAVGTGVGVIPVPCSFVLTEVRAFLVTAQTSGNLFTIDVKLDGTSILSTLLTIDNGEHSSTSATTPAVISTQQIPDDSVITVDVTQIGDGTAIELIVTLKGHKL